MVTRWTRVGACVGILAASIGFTVFLVDQGLGNASLWAAVLGLPVAVIAAVAGIWSTVLTVRSSREHDGEPPPHPDTNPVPAPSGGIRQSDNRGIAIAHTGSGDIHVTADASTGWQGESS
jgi:hypothetical protein